LIASDLWIGRHSNSASFRTIGRWGDAPYHLSTDPAQPLEATAKARTSNGEGECGDSGFARMTTIKRVTSHVPLQRAIQPKRGVSWMCWSMARCSRTDLLGLDWL
jgi:hypothetical protein